MISLAMASASAYAAKAGADAMVTQQAETANNQTREAYRVAQENDRAAQAQAFEAQTDRMRQASRELAMARVASAEGGGSLAARAINIQAGAAEDFSRIDAGLREQRSAVRGQVAAAQVGNIDALNMASTQFKANQVQFFSRVADAGISAGERHYKRQSDLKLAQDKVFDRVYSGTRSIGD